ncbi:MAG: DNA primase, partial [Muribaculaceae bacterium]|nr:DNA primase [Muribaculaceae bacterium]
MIPRETIARILDAANIVEVVGEYVSLHRRGSNYMGLCPFHNEKTPSFSVSPAKGMCYCFGCHTGGDSLKFLMASQQMTYVEAVKYLGKKYNIPVEERELTPEEKLAQSERETLIMVNQWAEKHFINNLYNTTEGKSVGLAYFYDRGFSDATIKKFRLGYALDQSSALYKEAVKQGFSRESLFSTGLCASDKHDGGFDKYKGRTIFPIVNLAGNVIAFGGRTLKNEAAKYINSPENSVYKKTNELYGLYQARNAIAKHGKCFLVEGYADVISMSQSGIENVVASCGTALTPEQAHLIHRFTDNVTLLYDGDNAGRKSALRGVDILLSEGLNVKVL